MIRILKRYIAKDLVKIAALATVVITIIMTILAIIEPLRERGLGGQQALKLFAYSLPVMFSLTLPVAALFAATFVYGRFSQDNELMAIRASGICPLALLRPAVWMGVIVSVVTLVLSLWLAPQLLLLSHRNVAENVKQAAYHQLLSNRHLKLPDLLIHADRVDPESGWLGGVIVIRHSDELNAKALIAPKARPDVLPRGDDNYIVIDCPRFAAMQQSGQSDLSISEMREMQRGKAPDLFEDKPRFYDWRRLVRVLANPMAAGVVEKELIQIRREMCIQRFYQDVITEISDKGEYDRLRAVTPKPGEEPTAGPDRVVLGASQALLEQRDQVILNSPEPATDGADAQGIVAVAFYRGQEPDKSFLARSVEIRAKWDEIKETFVVSVSMIGARVVSDTSDVGAGHEEYSRAQFAVPKDIVDEAQRGALDDLIANPSKYGLSADVTQRITGLTENVIPKLLRRVRAEMHWRIAYGVCCLLMVMIGAAMGMIFRGGQVLAAMAISAVPAALVIILLLMGKQLISGGHESGVGVIWGGVAAMAAVATYMYAVPMRR